MEYPCQNFMKDLLIAKLKVLGWAIEALDKDSSGDLIQVIYEHIIPGIEELKEQK